MYSTYSTYNERKSVIAERFIRTLKNKIFKHMTAISNNVYFDVLDDIVNKYKKKVHRMINMKPVDVTSDSYAEYNEDSIEKDPKFKVGDRVIISKYKIIFAKRYTKNWSEEIFIISKIENTVPWSYVISDLNVQKIDGTCHEKKFQRANQKEFWIEKIIKRKGDKSDVKWKGYNNSLNGWINKQDLV